MRVRLRRELVGEDAACVRSVVEGEERQLTTAWHESIVAATLIVSIGAGSDRIHGKPTAGPVWRLHGYSLISVAANCCSSKAPFIALVLGSTGVRRTRNPIRGHARCPPSTLERGCRYEPLGGDFLPLRLGAIVVASVLMIVAGVGKKRLQWRTVECPVCHHPRGSCTCRWL